MDYKVIKETLYIFFSGDFDYMNIQKLKEEVISTLYETSATNIVFDLSNISFIDSTGIGFILARYKQVHKLNKTLSLANLSNENKIILNMSGVFQIIQLIPSEVTYE